MPDADRLLGTYQQNKAFLSQNEMIPFFHFYDVLFEFACLEKRPIQDMFISTMKISRNMLHAHAKNITLQASDTTIQEISKTGFAL